jgi:hypothetical protein
MAIESYFRSCSDKECPKFMRKIFNDDLTPKAEEYRILFSFCSFALAQFNKFNLISQVLKIKENNNIIRNYY